MPKPIITGTLAPVKQPTEYTFDPVKGYSFVERWESAGDNLRGVAAQYASLRIPYNFIPSGHKSVIIATSSQPEGGQTEVTTDTWQILANEIQKSLREHPTFSQLEVTNPGEVGAMYAAAANNDRPPNGSVSVTAVALYDLLIRGVTHYALGQYVLRHSTNVSNGYGVNVADVNIEHVYTPVQLLLETQNATFWINPLPGRLAYKISNLSSPVAKTGYLWGWRKLPSTETTGANNRVDITTEYWLEQWPTVLYPAAVLA
jgi:hypothetical protein